MHLLIALCSLLHIIFHAATYGADYSLESNVLTFISGQDHYHNSTQCAHIMIVNDSVLESNEGFELSIIAAYPVDTGTINHTTVEILEDSLDCKLLYMYVLWSIIENMKIYDIM